MSRPSMIEPRCCQAFPTLTLAEVERLRRFGEVVATVHAGLSAQDEEAARAKEPVRA
jgi:hypothetical protein